MSNLDNLVAKIVQEAEAEANRILTEAKAKAARTAAERVAAAEKEKEAILSGADLEAEKAAEQIELGTALAIRDRKLNAKQAVVEKVFALALNKLNSMPKDSYWQFLSDSLAAMDLDGEELIVPPQYAVKDLDELNAFLKAKGKKGNLRLFDGERTVNGGFILVKDGIENNNTFETLIQYYRYELEGAVIKSLF